MSIGHQEGKNLSSQAGVLFRLQSSVISWCTPFDLANSESSENPDEERHLMIQPCRIQNRLETREIHIWQSCRVLNSTRLLEYERNLRYGKEEHAFVAGALHFWLILRVRSSIDHSS